MLRSKERALYQRYIDFLERQVEILQRPLGLEIPVTQTQRPAVFDVPEPEFNPNNIPIRMHLSEIEEDIHFLLGKDELSQEEADRLKRALGADIDDELPVNPQYDD